MTEVTPGKPTTGLTIPLIDDLVPVVDRKGRPGRFSDAERRLLTARTAVEAFLVTVTETNEGWQTQLDSAFATMAERQAQSDRLRGERDSLQASLTRAEDLTTSRKTDLPVVGQVISDLVREFGWRLTGMSDNSDEIIAADGKLEVYLEFDKRYLVAVIPAAGHALVEVPDRVKPRLATTGSDGLTSEGFGVVLAVIAFDKMKDADRQALPRRVHDDVFVVKQPTVDDRRYAHDLPHTD